MYDFYIQMSSTHENVESVWKALPIRQNSDQCNKVNNVKQKCDKIMTAYFYYS